MKKECLLHERFEKMQRDLENALVFSGKIS